MGKLKYFLYILCGIFAFSLISCHDTFALDYDTDKLGGFLFDVPNSYAVKDDGNRMNFTYTNVGGVERMYLSTSISIYTITVKFDRVIPKNSMINFYYLAETTSSKSDITDSKSYTTPFIIKAWDGKAYLYQTEYLSTTGRLGGSVLLPNNDKAFVSSAEIVNIKMIVTQDTDILTFSFDNPPTGYMELIPGSYIGLVNTSQDMKDIENSVNQGNQDAQDRFDKEQEQREEDKKASEDASNNSQSSSDDSQQQADNASKNLFQVLTEFVSAISGASASSCSITGDFGFFNVGSIDLCTGASKIQPITTVIGTVMLIGLCIPAVVTLLHRFVSLYNEVMS